MIKATARRDLEQRKALNIPQQTNGTHRPVSDESAPPPCISKFCRVTAWLLASQSNFNLDFMSILLEKLVVQKKGGAQSICSPERQIS